MQRRVPRDAMQGPTPLPKRRTAPVGTRIRIPPALSFPYRNERVTNRNYNLNPKSAFVLRTNLSYAECLARLHASLYGGEPSESSSRGTGPSPVIGSIQGREIQLRKRRSFRNDFAPTFHATLAAQDPGARVDGYFSTRVPINILMPIFLLVTIAVGIPVFLFSLRQINAGQTAGYIGLILPPALLVLGIVLWITGKRTSQTEQRSILNFLQITLIAHIEAQP